MHSHHLENQAIEVVAQALTTDDPSTYESHSAMNVIGYNMTKNCADKVFSEAGFSPGEGRDQVGVVELHDCFAANEVGLFTVPVLPTLDNSLCSSSRMKLSVCVQKEKHIRWLNAEIIPMGESTS